MSFSILPRRNVIFAPREDSVSCRSRSSRTFYSESLIALGLLSPSEAAYKFLDRGQTVLRSFRVTSVSGTATALSALGICCPQPVRQIIFRCSIALANSVVCCSGYFSPTCCKKMGRMDERPQIFLSSCIVLNSGASEDSLVLRPLGNTPLACESTSCGCLQTDRGETEI